MRRGCGHQQPRSIDTVTKCRLVLKTEGSTRSSQAARSAATQRRTAASEELVDRIEHHRRIVVHMVATRSYEDSYRASTKPCSRRLRPSPRGAIELGRGWSTGTRKRISLLDGAHGILVPGGLAARDARHGEGFRVRRSRASHFRYLLRFPSATVDPRPVCGSTSGSTGSTRTRAQSDSAARPARSRRTGRHYASRPLCLRIAKIAGRTVYGTPSSTKASARFSFNCCTSSRRFARSGRSR